MLDCHFICREAAVSGFVGQAFRLDLGHLFPGIIGDFQDEKTIK
jgi:hypothetical protein